MDPLVLLTSFAVIFVAIVPTRLTILQPHSSFKEADQSSQLDLSASIRHYLYLEVLQIY